MNKILASALSASASALLLAGGLTLIPTAANAAPIMRPQMNVCHTVKTKVKHTISPCIIILPSATKDPCHYTTTTTKTVCSR